MSHKTQENQKEIEEMIKEIESLPAALSSFQSKAITSMTFAMLIKLRSQRNLDKLLEYLRSHKEEIRSSQLRCMTKLNQVTRASTCNICSGNSQRFFSDSKILMRESECRAILGECETAWRGVVDILDLLDDYTDEVKKSYKEKLNNEHFDSLQAMSDTHKLSALFQRCPKLSTCDTEHVARVCERMISILTPSYAKFIAGTIQNKSQPLIFQILHGIGSLIVHAGKAIVDHAHNIARGVGHLLKGLTPATNAEAQKKPQQKPAQSQGLRKNRDRWALSARDGPQSTQQKKKLTIRNKSKRSGVGNIGSHKQTKQAKKIVSKRSVTERSISKRSVSQGSVSKRSVSQGSISQKSVTNRLTPQPTSTSQSSPRSQSRTTDQTHRSSKPKKSSKRKGRLLFLKLTQKVSEMMPQMFSLQTGRDIQVSRMDCPNCPSFDANDSP